VRAASGGMGNGGASRHGCIRARMGTLHVIPGHAHDSDCRTRQPRATASKARAPSAGHAAARAAKGSEVSRPSTGLNQASVCSAPNSEREGAAGVRRADHGRRASADAAHANRWHQGSRRRWWSETSRASVHMRQRGVVERGTTLLAPLPLQPSPASQSTPPRTGLQRQSFGPLTKGSEGVEFRLAQVEVAQGGQPCKVAGRARVRGRMSAPSGQHHRRLARTMRRQWGVTAEAVVLGTYCGGIGHLHYVKKVRGTLCFDHCQPLSRKPSGIAVPIALAQHSLTLITGVTPAHFGYGRQAVWDAANQVGKRFERQLFPLSLDGRHQAWLIYKVALLYTVTEDVPYVLYDVEMRATWRLSGIGRASIGQ